jgi:hypothetical protein
VELNPVTAAIAAVLYPDAQILNESLAGTRAPEASFDLVIGNVPFGKFTLNGRRLASPASSPQPATVYARYRSS